MLAALAYSEQFLYQPQPQRRIGQLENKCLQEQLVAKDNGKGPSEHQVGLLLTASRMFHAWISEERQCLIYFSFVNSVNRGGAQRAQATTGGETIV